MAIYLPKINDIEIVGFNKIFKEKLLQIDFNAPLNIILGGNGLGKTTLLQCIVYSLTGGMNNKEVESNTNERWGNEFFKRRVLPEELNSANIAISFNLGDNTVFTRRAIINNKILECKINNEIVNDVSYEDIVVDKGGYDNFDSFVFLVNRLLYLPESRRSLTWDYDAQVRTLMILSNDIINEKAYRSLRAEIKNLDSTKRHTIVKINQLGKKEKQIKIENSNNKEEKDEQKDEQKDNQESDISKDNSSTIEKKFLLTHDLQQKLVKRQELSLSLKEHENRRSNLAEEINSLSQIIRKTESEYIQRSLKQFTSKDTLLYGKTINYGICPCCGETVKEYQELAKERLSEGKCIICGTDQYENDDINTASIEMYNSQLNEKLLARDNANRSIIHLRNQIQSIDDEIFNIRKAITSIDYSTYINADRADNLEDDINDITELDDIDEILNKLVMNKENLESDIAIKTKEADIMYQSFIDNFEERNNQLSVIYRELASAFLGKVVTLEYERSPAKFVSINYLIPVFDNEARKSPEDCSEAQRFFLDIAFRMALIILNYKLTRSAGTFICETPESALDVSYVDNVVEMFLSFIKNDNRLIVSNNLQKLGLAYLMVNRANRGETGYTIFDLLEHGRLSNVQETSKDLFAIRDEIVKGDTYE